MYFYVAHPNDKCVEGVDILFPLPGNIQKEGSMMAQILIVILLVLVGFFLFSLFARAITGG
jgi:uncharacterized membrane protein YqaE (UPF0057 family)